jgi:hypothetical protein
LRTRFHVRGAKLISLVFILICRSVVGAATPALENMSTQQIPVNTIRELKEFTEPVPFYEALRKAFKKRKIDLDLVCPPADPVARRILEEYGAVYVASKKVKPPPVCVFTTEDQVTKFQEDAGVKAEYIAYDTIELQPEALKHLLKAREEAQKEGLDITHHTA